MKLNKRECRKFADPEFKMNLSDGILHAESVKYIAKAAVKIIDRHKTLVLHIYPREQAARGDFKPLWTMFHDRKNGEYVTLEQKADGTSKWRTSAFENLGENWSFVRECAFYSARDEKRLQKYFKNESDSGFMPLIKAQYKILECRSKERQMKKEKQIISRMSCVKSLPRGLKNWIHKSVMPSYFFYGKGGNDVKGVCSSCGKEVILSGVKQGVKMTCPHCHKELTCKPRSRRGYNMYDRRTVQVIQNTGDGEIVLRMIKIYYYYKDADVPEKDVYENARHFVYRNPDDQKYHCESYYYSYSGGILTNWKKGERPTYSPWQYSFEADMFGCLYTKNLLDDLAGTPFQYCPIADFHNHFCEPFLVLPFFDSYIKHPSLLEHLVKTKFYTLSLNLAYQSGNVCLDETQHRTHRILQVAAEDVDFLRSLDIDMKTLQEFQKYSGLKDRQKLLLWQMKNEISRDIVPVLEFVTPWKLMKYIDMQYEFLKLRKTSSGDISKQELVSNYRDYLCMCRDLEYDMKNDFILYPKNLSKSHDKILELYQQKSDAITKKKFIAAYNRIAGQLVYEKDGMKIVYPETPDDVIAEAHALHHCVDSYISRISKGECLILFLRKCEDESRPFYTIEIREQQIIQVRGSGNCSATPEVNEFIKAWEKRVLSRLDIAA